MRQIVEKYLESKDEALLKQLTTEEIRSLDRDTPAPKKKASKGKRARKANGQLKGDDPETPEVNEAWEAEA
jgi:hypothetical protein